MESEYAPRERTTDASTFATRRGSSQPPADVRGTTMFTHAGPPPVRLGCDSRHSGAVREHVRGGGQPTPTPITPAPATPAILSWTHVLTHPSDALWYFRGEHPSGFSTSARLRASGYSNAALLNWRITQGADKIAFQAA